MAAWARAAALCLALALLAAAAPSAAEPPPPPAPPAGAGAGAGSCSLRASPSPEQRAARKARECSRLVRDFMGARTSDFTAQHNVSKLVFFLHIPRTGARARRPPRCCTAAPCVPDCLVEVLAVAELNYDAAAAAAPSPRARKPAHVL